MKQLITGLLIAITAFCYSENVNAKTTEVTLAETSWCGEKQTEEKDEKGNTWYYGSCITFVNDTQCIISEVAIIVELDMESSNLQFEGIYKIEEPFVYVIIPSDYEGREPTKKILKLDGDVIKYTGTYGDFILDKWEEDENYE